MARRIHPNLDGLRGLAIAMVLVHHSFPSSASTFCLNGRMGVSIFFVISGFLICSLFFRELRHFGRIHLAAFFVRRVSRLMPLYYAVLAAEAVLVLLLAQYSATNQALFVDKLPSYLFYYSNWLESKTEGPFFVAWSLAVEEQFYLVFAFVFAFWRRGLALLVLVLLALKIIVLNVQVSGVSPASLPWRILFSYSEPILMGVAVAVLLESRGSFLRVVPVLQHPLSLVASTATVFTLIAFTPIEVTTGPTAQLFYLASAVMVGSIVLAPPLPGLRSGLLPSAGKVSYGIYLIHMMAFAAAKRFSDEPLWVLLAGGATTYCLALLIYRHFELPCVKAGRKTSQRLICPTS